MSTTAKIAQSPYHPPDTGSESFGASCRVEGSASVSAANVISFDVEEHDRIEAAANITVLPRQELAEQACHIELDLLGEPIGKQDQYIAAYGGITAFTFHTDGSVEAERVQMRDEALMELENNLLIFYSGVERAASQVLGEQKKSIQEIEGKEEWAMQ